MSAGRLGRTDADQRGQQLDPDRHRLVRPKVRRARRAQRLHARLQVRRLDRGHHGRRRFGAAAAADAAAGRRHQPTVRLPHLRRHRCGQWRFHGEKKSVDGSAI